MERLSLANASGRAAATRARSTADRLTEIRARLERLSRGEPATDEDVRRARQMAGQQALALVAAQDRLLTMRRLAAARHEAHMQLARAGRAPTHEATTAPPPGPEGSFDPQTHSPACPPVGTEVERLRQALVAMLAWSGGGDPDEPDRRHTWCQAVVECPGAPGWQGWLDAVCRVAADALDEVRGVAINVGGGTSAEFVSASDPWTARVQDLELILGEGPATVAYTDNRPFIVDDLAQKVDAWPAYVSASSALDVHGIYALPLRVHGICVGAFTLYTPGTIGDHDRLDATAAVEFSDIAAAALLADIERTRCDPTVDDRNIVPIAVGALAARLGISIQEAEARLQAHAFSHEIGLVEAAQQVIEGGADLT